MLKQGSSTSRSLNSPQCADVDQRRVRSSVTGPHKYPRHVVLVLAALASHGSFAGSSSQNTVTPSSGDDVKAGDNIFFQTDAGIFKLVPSPSQGPPAPVYYCAPAGSRFVVHSITPASTDQGSKTDPKPADTTVVQGYFPDGGLGVKTGLHLANTIPTDQAASHKGCGGAEWISLGATYEFTSDNFKSVASQRAGFTWGAMIIPYKYYFTDHSIKGNPSTVAYAGYEGWFPGVSLAAVGAAGLGVAPSSSNSSVSTTAGGTPPSSSSDSSTSATYTVALGLIATFGGSIKAGVVVGRDYQSNAAGFKYENKTWLALSVGASF
jgi:hypothetical protein